LTKPSAVVLWSTALLLPLLLVNCASSPGSGNESQGEGPTVLVVESWLGDLAQDVAGDRLQVKTLIPAGLDPHAFEPAPQDVARIAESDVLIVNGAGLETWLEETLVNAGGDQLVIEAARGLKSRQPGAGEVPEDNHSYEDGDPHFWLDPVLVVQYVVNIRDGLVLADPVGSGKYNANAAATVTRLQELDAWMRNEFEAIPPEQRLLVTNHESLGYFADRYGFKVIGAAIPSFSTNASPSARETAGLVEAIRSSGARAIFLETGSNPALAEQIARETGIRVISGLYTHSTSSPEGPAPTYYDMMKENTRLIVEGLK
jgi:ABC-type Zn uptake system ZnuABC Zn-binding protein ZnuA